MSLVWWSDLLEKNTPMHNAKQNSCWLSRHTLCAVPNISTFGPVFFSAYKISYRGDWWQDEKDWVKPCCVLMGSRTAPVGRLGNTWTLSAGNGPSGCPGPRELDAEGWSKANPVISGKITYKMTMMMMMIMTISNSQTLDVRNADVAATTIQAWRSEEVLQTAVWWLEV